MELRREGLNFIADIQVVFAILHVQKSSRCHCNENNYRQDQSRTQEFFSMGSTNSVEDREQRERGYSGVAHLSGVPGAAVIWYKIFHFIQ